MTVKFIREHCVILFRVRICFYQTVLARLSRNIHMKGCYKKRDQLKIYKIDNSLLWRSFTEASRRKKSNK